MLKQEVLYYLTEPVFGNITCGNNIKRELSYFY